MNFYNSPDHTWNQLDVLKETILSFIHSYQIQSLLDIGAGSIATAAAYSSAVTHYLGIEQYEDRYADMEAAGIPVILEKFPCQIERQYELVLISHALPEVYADYEEFCRCAWEAVAPDGYLLMITFKGGNSIFRKVIAPESGQNDKVLYSRLYECLTRLGIPATSKIFSYQQSKYPEDIANNLYYSSGSNNPACYSSLLNLVKTRFRHAAGYRYPHDHLVISMKKTIHIATVGSKTSDVV